MSMHADVLPRSGLIDSAANIAAPARARACGVGRGWDPENFAREQIRGLVRRVFFTNSGKPVKQVVFSAAESTTDVRDICLQVGNALALKTPVKIAFGCQNYAQKGAG